MRLESRSSLASRKPTPKPQLLKSLLTLSHIFFSLCSPDILRADCVCGYLGVEIAQSPRKGVHVCCLLGMT